MVNKKELEGLVLSVLIAEAVGFLSGFLARNSRQVYDSLIKPSMAPPGWLFPVVWTILYALMGIAAYKVYSSDVSKTKKRNALIVYSLQLLVNFSWSIVFFRYGLIGYSVFILILLDILVIICTILFYRIDKKSAFLMIPYIIWILYATDLNAAIWLLNS